MFYDAPPVAIVRNDKSDSKDILDLARKHLDGVSAYQVQSSGVELEIWQIEAIFRLLVQDGEGRLYHANGVLFFQVTDRPVIGY